MQISVTIDDEKVKAKLQNLVKGMGDLSEPMDEVGEKLIDFYEGNFDNQGADLGKTWSPLSVYTLQARARGYGHYKNPSITRNKILIWTGALKGGFKKVVTRTSVTISNTVDYFKHNQRKRPMLGVNNKVTKIVKDTIQNYIKKLL